MKGAVLRTDVIVIHYADKFNYKMKIREEFHKKSLQKVVEFCEMLKKKAKRAGRIG